MGSLLADSWHNRDIFKPCPELLVFGGLIGIPALTLGGVPVALSISGGAGIVLLDH